MEQVAHLPTCDRRGRFSRPRIPVEAAVSSSADSTNSTPQRAENAPPGEAREIAPVLKTPLDWGSKYTVAPCSTMRGV